MRRNSRLGGIRSSLLMTAVFIILPVFGVSVTNAQRPPAADDADSVRPVTRIQEPGGPVLEQPQPIVGQTTGIPGQEPQVVNVIAVPNRPFTLASSAGAVDEDSTSVVQLRNFTVTFLPATTGALHVRYNITAVDDVSRFCPATQSMVRVRFRNSDDTGATAQVFFEIRRTNITSGGNTVIYTFNSNGRGAGATFTTASDSPSMDFDFANNIYWIEATIFRSDPNALADLGSIQIWESGGTPCP